MAVHHRAALGILRRGTKGPKCWACWPAAQPLRGPAGLLKGVLLTERAGTKVLNCVGIHTAEAGGLLGAVREAVSREWLPGAPSCLIGFG